MRRIPGRDTICWGVGGPPVPMSLKTLLHSLRNPGQQPEPHTVADPSPHFTEGQPEDGRATSLPLPQLDFTLELPSHWPLPGPPAKPLGYYGVTSRGTSLCVRWRSWSASAECWVLGHQEVPGAASPSLIQRPDRWARSAPRALSGGRCEVSRGMAHRCGHRRPRGGSGPDPRQGLERRWRPRETPSDSARLRADTPSSRSSVTVQCGQEAPCLRAEAAADVKGAAKGAPASPSPIPPPPRPAGDPGARLTGWRAGPGRAPTGRRARRRRPAGPRGRART